MNSSIELAQVMKSLGAIHDFSYIVIFHYVFSSKWKRIVFFFCTFASRMKTTILEDNIFDFEPCEEDGSVLLAEETPWRGFADELQALHYLKGVQFINQLKLIVNLYMVIQKCTT